MLRVRKDHTCISLELYREDESNVCDKCLVFRQRQNGIGRRLKNGAVPKCEQPWFLECKDNTHHRSVTKQKKFIDLLNKYNYKITDYITKKEIDSRLYGT